MRKSLFFLLLAFLLAACTSEEKPYVSSHVEVIPNDADMVLRIDVQQLLQKSGALRDEDTRDALFEAFVGTRQERAWLNDILSVPASSGIDWQQPVYVVVDMLTLGGMFSMAVSDTLRLSSFLRENDIDDATYDERKLLLPFGRQNPDVSRYLTLDSLHLACRDHRFDAFFASTHDLAMWYKASLAIQIYLSGSELDSYFSEISKASAHYGCLTCHFLPGQILLANDLSDAPEAAAVANNLLLSPYLGPQWQEGGAAAYDFLPTLLRQSQGLPEVMVLLSKVSQMNYCVEDAGHATFRVELIDHEQNALRQLTDFALAMEADEEEYDD